MADDRTLAYADALFEVARAEGTLGEVEDELFRFSQTLQGNDELRDAVTNAGIPAARRQQIVEDLLGGKASQTTVALVSMVVGTGRARDLPTIIQRLVEMSAAEANKRLRRCGPRSAHRRSARAAGQGPRGRHRQAGRDQGGGGSVGAGRHRGAGG